MGTMMGTLRTYGAQARGRTAKMSTDGCALPPLGSDQRLRSCWGALLYAACPCVPCVCVYYSSNVSSYLPPGAGSRLVAK